MNEIQEKSKENEAKRNNSYVQEQDETLGNKKARKCQKNV